METVGIARVAMAVVRDKGGSDMVVVVYGACHGPVHTCCQRHERIGRNLGGVVGRQEVGIKYVMDDFVLY